MYPVSWARDNKFATSGILSALVISDVSPPNNPLIFILLKKSEKLDGAEGVAFDVTSFASTLIVVTGVAPEVLVRPKDFKWS